MGVHWSAAKEIYSLLYSKGCWGTEMLIITSGACVLPSYLFIEKGARKALIPLGKHRSSEIMLWAQPGVLWESRGLLLTSGLLAAAGDKALDVVAQKKLKIKSAQVCSLPRNTLGMWHFRRNKASASNLHVGFGLPDNSGTVCRYGYLGLGPSESLHRWHQKNLHSNILPIFKYKGMVSFIFLFFFNMLSKSLGGIGFSFKRSKILCIEINFIQREQKQASVQHCQRILSNYRIRVIHL